MHAEFLLMLVYVLFCFKEIFPCVTISTAVARLQIRRPTTLSFTVVALPSKNDSKPAATE